MMTMTLLGLLFLFATGFAANEPPVARHFGTKTPYAFSGEPASNAANECKVVNVNLVSRHASRYPTGSTIEALQALQLLLAENNRSLLLPWLASWKSRFGPLDEGLILPGRGVNELEGMGRRFATRFPEILSADAYTPNMVYTQASFKARTSQSAIAFGRGMLGSSTLKHEWAVLTESKRSDKTLRFFDNCLAWKYGVKENDASSSESRDYASVVMPAIAARLAQKTGLPSDLVTVDVAGIMWDACRYDQVIFGESETWCSLFTEEDAEMIEFKDDLQSYYQRGYGSDINWMIAAPLMQDVIENMQAILSGDPNTDDYYTAKLRFGHAETVMPLLALLGLHRDEEPPKASWSKAQQETRKWRTSAISPFATNVAFVLMKCANEMPFVQVLEQERPVALPGCDGLALCPFEKFKAVFEPYTTIDFNDLCQNDLFAKPKLVQIPNNNAADSEPNVVPADVVPEGTVLEGIELQEEISLECVAPTHVPETVDYKKYKKEKAKEEKARKKRKEKKGKKADREDDNT